VKFVTMLNSGIADVVAPWFAGLPLIGVYAKLNVSRSFGFVNESCPVAGRSDLSTEAGNPLRTAEPSHIPLCGPFRRTSHI
jgi:hypothetical protein